MLSRLYHVDSKSLKALLIIAVIISLLLSLSSLLPYQPINIDGTLYIKTALIYQQQGLMAAMKVYPWPFYSILVVELSKIIHIDLLTAFYAASFILQALLVVAFILLVKELGGDKQILFWAAVTILFSAFLSHYRNEIIRDFGYWAFGVWSLVYFVRYAEKRTWISIHQFYILMAIAALFRIEGVVMICLLPLPLLFLRSYQVVISPVQNWVRMLTLPLLVGTVVIISYVVFGKHDTASLGRLREVYTQAKHGIALMVQNENIAVNAIEQYVLDAPAKGQGRMLLWGGLTTIWLLGMIHAIRWSTFILSLIGQARNLITGSLQKKVLYWAILVNAAMLAVFTGQMFFLSDRYAAFMAFIFLAWVPFAISDIIYYRHFNGKCRLFFWVTILFLVVMVVGSVKHFGVSKHYIYKASQWSRANLSHDLPIVTNDYVIQFYTAKAWESLDQSNQLKQIRDLKTPIATSCNDSYIIWQINHGQSLPAVLQNQDNWLKVFSNHRGDRVIVAEACLQ